MKERDFLKLKSRDRQRGMSLLEVMLVLAIAASIITMSIKMFNRYTLEKNIELIKGNVDSLFQAMAYYYQANCQQYKYSGSVEKAGALDPDTSPTISTTDSFLINITTQLSPTFLSGWPFVKNPLINPSTGNIDYIAQFNPVMQTRAVCKDSACTSAASIANIGTILIWKSQVAILLKDTTANGKNMYRGVLAADCLSSLNGTTVHACSDNLPGDYLVWERLPRFSSPRVSSDLWPSMPLVSQFTQMYTTYPINKLTSGTEITNQYYLCGG